MPRRFKSRALLVCAIALLTVTLMPLSQAFAAPAAQDGAPPNSIKILPINDARLLVGQRFDLRIEVGNNLAENTDPATFTVTVDGKPVSQYFGVQPEKSNSTPTAAELTLRNVSFSAPGKHTVRAVAGPSAAEVTYNIVGFSASSHTAKNVILFIGDGMGSNAITMARVVSRGLSNGRFTDLLNMDKMDEMGMVSTSGYDSLVTDSANSASAYATGNKSVVNAMGVYEDNTASPFDDPRVENLTELVKRTRSMATGLVVTSEIEDATPSAFIAHTRRRAEKQYIADQLLDDPLHQPEVIMGGGSAYFIPKSTPGSKRTDERNLLQDFKSAGYTVVGNGTELSASGTPQRLLGLFHPNDMNVWIDREYTKDPAVLGPYTDQPSLPQMTKKAIDILSANPNGKQNGFFLMVEGSSIDKQLHPMDWERGVGDLIEMDNALKVALDYAAKNKDTLVVVTADHNHSVSLYGTYDTTMGPGNPEAVGIYADAKFPTFKNRGDGFPETWNPTRTLAVGFGDHPAYRDDFIFNPQPLSATVRDPSVTNKDVYIPNPKRDPQGILYPANIPAFESTEVHSADDVPLFASGPGARAFHGHHDNTDVFLGIAQALGLNGTARSAAVKPVSAPASGSSPVGLALGSVFALTAVIGVGGYMRRSRVRSGRLGTAVRRLSAAAKAASQSFRDTLRDK